MSDATTPAATEGATGPSAIERDGLTPAMLTTARATWVACGHDGSIFDSHYGLTPAVPTASTPASARDVAAPAAPAVPPLPQDTRTEEQQQFDANMLMDRQYPAESYTLDYRAAGLIHESTEQLLASRAEWQRFGHAMQLQPGLFASLIQDQGIRDGRARAAMSPAERTLWEHEQNARALQAAGGDPARLQAMKDDAGRAIAAAIQRGADQQTVEALKASGWFHDATVLQVLAAQGANLAAWQAGRPKS